MFRPSAGETLRTWLLSALVVHGAVAGNPDAKRLYDDLLSNYNKLVRPVVNTSDVLRVCIKLKLSQLIDVTFRAPSIPPFCYSTRNLLAVHYKLVAWM
ncbi:D-arabinose 1-dehydrogenase (NAD(P)(+)) [Polyplax serrata]|uniref:D-arabinose 1-dehydrogenase (NAD(P)(+)) n=1 Tax=Polyplax serrata TaxID=468196 RepID=A0AAN8XNW6_POLSC